MLPWERSWGHQMTPAPAWPHGGDPVIPLHQPVRAAGASVWPTDEVLDCWTELVSGPLVIQRYMAERVVTVPVPPSLFTLFPPLRTRVYVERRDPPGAGARFGSRLESPKTQGAW